MSKRAGGRNGDRGHQRSVGDFSDLKGRRLLAAEIQEGLFGPVSGILLTSISRGYTDLAAALIVVGLDAEELQIIHAQTPIRIKNVMSPMGPGMVISPDNASRVSTPDGRMAPPPLPKVLLENGYQLNLSRRHPTAVTIKDNVWVLNVHSNHKSVSHGFFAQIFGALDTHGIVIDLVSTSEVHVSMALGANVNEKAIGKAMLQLRSIGTVDVTQNMAMLSLVDKQMKNMVDISERMFSTLVKAGINLEMISQGASEINISCVILKRQALQAMNVIYEELLDNLGREAESQYF
ncbi:Aspartokinase [Gamsiella multidivaricata]|nr:Aspartokinase [Gamsiella multidivaricata]